MTKGVTSRRARRLTEDLWKAKQPYAGHFTVTF